jgi:hypothetical protein
MMIKGRIQKCRGSKRIWQRHKNNKMSEKFKRMKKKKKKKQKKKKKKKKKKRQHTAVQEFAVATRRLLLETTQCPTK